jgi:DMSO/TMAO reductase YedYZ molybdopterin-dependent catalytic subunit
MTRRYARRTLRGAASAAVGLLAAAVSIGIAQLAAAFTGPLGLPVIAVGTAAINLTPVQLKDFAVQHFGTDDKLVLLSGIVLVLAVLAAVTGLLAMRRRAYGFAGIAVFGSIGLAGVLSTPGAGLADSLPTLIGAVAGALALALLVRALASQRSAPAPGPAAPGPAAPGPAAPGPARLARRGFLLAAAGTAAVAAAGGGLGEVLLRRFSVSAARADVALPRPAIVGPAAPAGAQLPVPGISSFTTPNASFYRVDTALLLPQVPPDQWRLRVHGMVDRELDLSFEDLLRRPLTEADMTIACVSNQVGGPYVGNARWLGASLASLLREAGLQRGADQVLSTASDGWTCGTPVETVMDGRNALVAVGMNGQPLPIEHGFPARMLVPGLYGYVSATKWLVDLELTTFAAQRSYWVQRGYSAQAPIKTESRIDVPKPLQQIKAGQIAVAGVAWAPHRGIGRVQVRADSGAWNDAKLAAVPGIDTWRQWVWEWDATPGLHQLEVRATDESGAVQPARRVPIFPNGATGWDSVAVTVT